MLFKKKTNSGDLRLTLLRWPAPPHPPRHSHRRGHTGRDGRQCMPTNDRFGTSEVAILPIESRPFKKHTSPDKYLEDHPRTCRWLRTMVIVGDWLGVVGPPSKWPNFMAKKIGGDPKYFLTGMILEVPHVPENRAFEDRAMKLTSRNKTKWLNPSYGGGQRGKNKGCPKCWWCPLSKKWVGDLFYISLSNPKIWRTGSSLNAGHTWSFSVVENQHIFTKVPGAYNKSHSKSHCSGHMPGFPWESWWLWS